MSGEGRRDLLRNIAALDATVTIARSLAGQTDLETILDLIAKRGRALVSARALAIELREEGRTVVAAAAGELPQGLIGAQVDPENSVGLDAEASLVVPLTLRGRSYGALVAVDRQRGGPEFTLEDEELLETFAASAATAVATARMFDVTRRRDRLAAGEAERARWARELHDETLQGLRAVRMSLAAMRGAEPAAQELVQRAIATVETEIERLHSLVTDLRPVVLDQLGIGAAIEALADRIEVPDLEVRTLIDLSFEGRRVGSRPDDELETAIYRIVQEALNNTVKHAGASCIVVEVIKDDERGEVRLSVRDDGKGFDPTADSGGFGLDGIRERVEVLGGSIEISSALGEGTEIRVVVPVIHP